MTASIIPARSAEEMDVVRMLFREYADAIKVDLCTQGFDAELAGLPGKYAEPAGCILLAMAGGVAAGCAALRPLGDGTCEMKRLYVRPGGRGTGLGRALVERLVEEARARGYRAVRLDTVPSKMGAAVGLYRSLGFAPIAPYACSELPGVEYMELRLREG